MTIEELMKKVSYGSSLHKALRETKNENTIEHKVGMKLLSLKLVSLKLKYLAEGNSTAPYQITPLGEKLLAELDKVKKDG